MGRSKESWSPPLVGEADRWAVSLWVPGALASGDGFDIADSPGTVADIRGLNAMRVGHPTNAARLVGRRAGR